MHHISGSDANCDMDLSHPGRKLQSCPDPAPRYVASLGYVRVAPPTLAIGDQTPERVPLLASPVATEISFDVASPPPRTALA